MRETATLCPYCGVGCGLLVEVREGRVARVRGDPEHPSSLGDLCAKAVHLPPTLRTDDRLLYPHVRARRDGALSRVPWELALRTDIHGSSVADWKTTPRSVPGPSISRPPMTTPPVVGWLRPMRIESTVDLPQPEWPSRQTNSPSST